MILKIKTYQLNVRIHTVHKYVKGFASFYFNYTYIYNLIIIAIDKH